MSQNYNFSIKKNFIFVSLMITALMIFLMFITPACGKKGKKIKKSSEYDLETAKIISHITSGIISPDEKITVKFANPIADKDMAGKIINKNLFSFSPGINGSLKWDDSRTIVFTPVEKLPFRTEYSGTFYPEKINAFKEAKPVKFSFETSGREILNLTGYFDLSERKDPKYLIYKGTVQVSEPVRIEDVRKGVNFFFGNRIIPLTFEESVPGKIFSFSSVEIKREAYKKVFYINISKDKLDISRNIKKIISLEPLGEFKVVELIKFDRGEAPGIEIRFSDFLDTKQDMRGLVRIIPRMDISLKVLKKSIYVSGNFEYGKTYQGKISGIRSRWGVKLKGEQEKTIVFEDKKPQISFSSSGVFLPSSNKRVIGFKTINVSEVKIVLKRVFESNLGQFLQTESLDSGQTRNNSFNVYESRRVGVKIAEKTLKIGKEKNRWFLHQIDLNKLLEPEDKGLYLIKLSFERKAMLYSGLKKKPGYYYGMQYYSNPNSWGYLYRHGEIYKPVIISDIGITYKRGGTDHSVFATNLIDSTPMSDVKITLKTFQNQVAAVETTDNDGKAVFRDIKEKIFIVEGEKNGQRSVVKPSEMEWNLSSFDTGGVVGDIKDTRAFIYSDRGVYRPGDTINISLIARNRDNTFPDNHPVTLKLYNPKNQLIKSIVNKKSSDGFFNFQLSTDPADMTGNWKVKLLVGSESFYKTVKIETVVPNRLKVKVEPSKKILDQSDKYIEFKLRSTYLFGAPAANLAAKSKITLKNRFKKFPEYHGFIFTDELLSFKNYKRDLFSGTLDSSGLKEVRWKLPDLKSVPSAINAEISSKVFEKGGRFTADKTIIPIEPYNFYIGLEKPVSRWNYGRVGKKMNIGSVLVSKDGKIVSGKSLKYSIFRNSRNWWWEYDSLRNFKVKYKNDVYTRLIKEGNVITKGYPITIEFTPQDSGEYFIEVEESVGGGHKAGFFFSSYYWGESPQKDVGAGTLILKTDRKIYNPGQKAILSFERPKKGTILVSIEKGNRILNTLVFRADDSEIEHGVKIPITDEMLPNVYASVSIIQPHSQTLNDRPIRIYGTIPLMVEENSTHHYIEIKSSDEFKTGKDFSVEVMTKDGKDTQFTIAVVDEGLLDLTGFTSPDPWKYFFKKQKLGVATFDLFNSVIGANKGDIYRLFSVGGEMEMAKSEFRASQLGPKKARRFKPVAIFRGPLKTDKNGYKKLKFKMPEYIGAVRIMVVAADNKRFGMGEKLVPVKTDLMILPTFPRVLGPGDSIDLPVTVFAMKKGIGKVKISLEVSGPLKIVGENKKSLKFNDTGEKDISFGVMTDQAIGNAKIVIKAKSGRYHAEHTTQISVRPSSPRIYNTIKRELSPGETVSIRVPNDGIRGSNRAVLTISKRAKLNIENRLGWIIHYPYGCVEQTVSSVFPQLYLKEFMKNGNLRADEIDKNINKAIERLRKFALPTGGLSYWPGGKRVSVWGSNYAAHFLLESKKRGYSVPNELYSGLISFLKTRSVSTSDNIMVRVHRLYILALAGQPQIGPMNLIYENDLKTLSNINRWMLAASYYLSGKKSVRDKILKNVGTNVAEYSEEGVTFGSGLRDRAIILDILTKFKDWNKADIIYDMITEDLSMDSWFSTQSLGYSLLALGKYITLNKEEFRSDDSPVAGYVKFPDGSKKSFSFKEGSAKLTINSGFGKQVQIHISKNTSLKKVFAFVNWNGVPLKYNDNDISKNISLNVRWYDENGLRIDPSLLRQGTTFWGRFRVSPGPYTRRFIKNIALVQMIPAGWEIENTRLSGDDMPEWMNSWQLNMENFLDIRDDRIIWFLNLPGRSNGYDFVVKLNCITAGKFTLPPTVAETMYSDKFRARRKGYKVQIIKR